MQNLGKLATVLLLITKCLSYISLQLFITNLTISY